MAVGHAHCVSWLSHTSANTTLFFPKPPTTFLTCFCRGERRKYARKKVSLNRGSNSQPPGHEPDTRESNFQLLQNYTKTKRKRRVTFKDSFKGFHIILLFFV